jgi:hypothetical protein
MSSTATTSSYEPPCSRHGWEVPDGYAIAARAFASPCLSGRLWALNGREEL